MDFFFRASLFAVLSVAIVKAVCLHDVTVSVAECCLGRSHVMTHTVLSKKSRQGIKDLNYINYDLSSFTQLSI